MARTIPVLVLAGLLVSFGSAREVRAGATVDLLFVGRNGGGIAPTTSIGALPGDTLTMAVVMRNDVPLTIALFSLLYDLGGDDELSVVAAFGWRGFNTPSLFFFPQPFAIQKTTTFVAPFGGSNWVWPANPLPVAAGTFAGGYQVGTVVWKVNAGVNDDGADILSSLENVLGLSAFGFAVEAFNSINDSVLLQSATVNFVPEPGTAALLGLGLLGLLLLRRRRS